MKYLFTFLAAVLLYVIIRPLATLWYFVWYRKSPNFKVYFLYTEKSALRNIEKYFVYKNIMDYVKGSDPMLVAYADESKPYRYFPEAIIEFS